MTLTVDLTPELEARLKEEAARQGMNAPEFARKVLTDNLEALESNREGSPPFYETATRQQWKQKFREWIASHNYVDAPPIPLESLRREHLYEDRS